MRKISQALSVSAVLLAAVPAQAQTRNVVRVDFTAPAPVVKQGAAAPGTSRWSGGLRFGVGNGSFDLVDDNCADLVLPDFNLDCDGDDSGVAWLGAADIRWLVTDLVDVGLRGGVIRPSKITLNGTATIEGLDISADASGQATIWTLGAEVGVRPTPRFRLYGGAGLSPFTFDSKITITVFDLTESEEQENSGVGRALWGGAEWIPSARDPWAIYAEFHRTSLKDDDVGSDEEPFDEAFKGFFVGVRWSFGR